MPSVPYRAVVTGLSSTFGLNNSTWWPDYYSDTLFNVGIGVTVNSSNVTYNIEHTFDRLGNLSSNFNNFISTAATWFLHSTLSGQSSNSSGNYAFAVTGIRLNVTAGSSTGSVTATFIQAF
jgi:hypothetical protein